MKRNNSGESSVASMGIIIKIFTVLGFIYALLGQVFLVSAAPVHDSDFDDTTLTANFVDLGDTITGSITETDDLDYYEFSLESAGCVKLDMTSYMQYYCIRIYDAEGEEVWYTDWNEWIDTVGKRQDHYDLYLEKGSYYMQVNGYRCDSIDKSTGTYECNTSFVSSQVNNVETDNSFATASNLTLGKPAVGQISENDDYDNYSFSLSEPGCVKLDLTSYMRYYCIRLYDADGEELWYSDWNEWVETVGKRQDHYDLYLETGTYYIQVNGYRCDSIDKSTGKYVVGTNFVPTKASFEGEDNSIAAAKPIVWNQKYTGQISINDDYDTYKFSISGNDKLVIDMTSYMQYYCIKIFNPAGKEVWYSDWNEWNAQAGFRKDKKEVVLSPGIYYMQINGYRCDSIDKSTGKYIFFLERLTQQNCSHEYKETTAYPTYFSKGYEFHKCGKCGKNYKDHYTAKRKLGQGSIAAWSSGGKGRISLEWYTVSDASGYQIRYSKRSKMDKGVHTQTVRGGQKMKKTIKKLSRRKKYYVQVRAYKASGANKAYGKWSKKFAIKTK